MSRRTSRRSAKASRKRWNIFEPLERRQMLAAHIQGDPTSYSTIQSAIDAATAGATINVDPGTYSEWISINKPLTLLGAQAGVDARSNARPSANETIMNGISLGTTRSASISVDADNVTVDGFTITGTTSQDTAQGAGLVIGPNRAGAHIYDNIFQNNTSGMFLANNSSTNPAIIYHNVFKNNNNAGQEGGRGIYTNGELSGGNLTNVQIDSNYFYNNRGSTGTTGLEAAMAFEALTAGKQSNISITNNAMDNNGKAVLFFNTIGVTITGNVITQTLDKYSGTLRFEGNNQNVTITGNTLYNNTGPAVAVDSKGVPGSSSGFVVNNNNIYGNSTGWSGSHIGVITDSTAYDGVPDDRNNYWGSATGPGGDGPGTGDWVYGIGHVVSGNQWVFTPGGNELWSPFSSGPIGSLRSPYFGLAATSDALLQTENYDAGGEGNAYHDLDASNSGGQYRAGQGVDLETTTDTNGGYDLTNAKAGEWVGYTLNVPVGGVFTIDFRVANAQTTGGKFHLVIDGNDVTGQLTVPTTGGAQTWTTLSKTGVSIGAGTHDVRLTFDTNGSSGTVGSFNWLKFTNTSVINSPAAPTNLMATAPTAARVNLSWTDKSDNESGFIIERKTGVSGTWGPLMTTLANVTSYIDTSVQPGTLYIYRVRATNPSGDSTNSNEATITTPIVTPVTYLSDLPFAGTPTNGWGPVERDQNVGGSGAGDGTTLVLNGVSYLKGLGTNSVSDITFNLDGLYKTFLSDVGVDDTQSFSGSVQFQVFADGVLKFDSGVMTPTSTTQNVLLDVSNVQQLRLHVGDGGDDSDFDWADWAGARLTTDTAVLAAPSDLVATALSATQVKLTWTDHSVGESGFKIERSTNGIDFTQVGLAAGEATTFVDSTAQPGTSYTYRVRATTGTTDSDPSNTYSVTTTSVPSVTYVSDMQWALSTNGWGPVERDMNVGGQSANDGTALKLAGVTYTKGLGTNSPSEVDLNLSGAYGWFVSDVGVDDKQTTSGTVTFQVWADGVKVYDSGLMTATSATKNIVQSLAGVQQLKLIVTDGGDGNAFDWADWANARLLAPGPAPAAPTAPTGLAATVAGTAINLGWTDTSTNEDNLLVERSTNGTTFAQIAALAHGSNSYNDTTVLSGVTYTYRVRAANGFGDSGYSNTSANTVNPIPAGWTQADIGSVGTATGSAAFDGTTYTVRGGGSSTGAFTSGTDAFHYLYQSKTGNVTISAKVATLQNTNTNAKAGILIRNTTATNSPFVGLFVTPSGGIKFVRRSTAGGAVTTTTVTGITAPVYLRLIRSANTFTAQRSADGNTWTTIASASVTLTSTVTTGLAVSSAAANTLNTSTFSNVTIV